MQLVLPPLFESRKIQGFTHSGLQTCEGYFTSRLIGYPVEPGWLRFTNAPGFFVKGIVEEFTGILRRDLLPHLKFTFAIIFRQKLKCLEAFRLRRLFASLSRASFARSVKVRRHREVALYSPDDEPRGIGDLTPSLVILLDKVLCIFDLIENRLSVRNLEGQLTRLSFSDTAMR